MRALLLPLVALLIGAAPAGPAADAMYFKGAWACAGTTWTWSQLFGDDSWLRVEYGDPKDPAGQAVMGWVPRLQRFVYRDFHADGSYADLTSTGLVNGRWVFTGPYYPADGSAPLNGQISYVVVSPARYDRIFETLRDGSLVKLGGDTCTRH